MLRCKVGASSRLNTEDCYSFFPNAEHEMQDNPGVSHHKLSYCLCWNTSVKYVNTESSSSSNENMLFCRDFEIHAADFRRQF
jgi:hypothetical protein